MKEERLTEREGVKEKRLTEREGVKGEGGD